GQESHEQESDEHHGPERPCSGRRRLSRDVVAPLHWRPSEPCLIHCSMLEEKGEWPPVPMPDCRFCQLKMHRPSQSAVTPPPAALPPSLHSLRSPARNASDRSGAIGRTSIACASSALA